MASADGDVDMSPPVTLTRAQLPLPHSATPPSRKHCTNALKATTTAQPIAHTEESPPATMTSPLTAPQGPTLATAAEEAFDEVRRSYFKREAVVREYSKALDEATARLHELGLESLTEKLTTKIGQILGQYARGDVNLEKDGQQQRYLKSQNTSPHTQDKATPTYAQAASAHRTGKALLPNRPTTFPPIQSHHMKKADNRVFIRLPEEHPSREHHTYAVKAALTKELELEQGSLKTVQKVKSGFAIVPNDEKQAEKILSKAQAITTTIGGTVEKAEEWYTYIIDHVPRSLDSLDGKRWRITEEYAREEVQAVTGTTPTKVAWSRKTMENFSTTGTIVAHFKQPMRPFRLFCSSSMARKLVKSPRPTQCSKCWGFHDARTCNHEQRCKNCSVVGHSFCQAAPRCSNCKGPHSAEERYCPARPTTRNGTIRHLTQSELKRIRQAGHRAWLLVNPVNNDTEKPPAVTQC